MHGGAPFDQDDNNSNPGSNYDVVEEMYENLNSFDKRLK